MNYYSLLVSALICGFCMQNSDFRTGIQVSMGTRPHLSFCAYKTTWLALESIVSMGSSPHRWFCAFKTAPLGPKLHVSMDPSPYLWFLHTKQRLLEQHTSLYGYQTSPVVLCIQNSMLSTKIKRLYGFQPSRVVLCMQISDFSTWITTPYLSQPSSVVFACKTATFGPAYKSLWVPDLTCRFVHTKQRD